jgi:hypothetical protein
MKTLKKLFFKKTLFKNKSKSKSTSALINKLSMLEGQGVRVFTRIIIP